MHKPSLGMSGIPILGMGQQEGGKLGLAHLGPFGSGSADPAWKPPQTLGKKENPQGMRVEEEF